MCAKFLRIFEETCKKITFFSLIGREGNSAESCQRLPKNAKLKRTYTVKGLATFVLAMCTYAHKKENPHKIPYLH